jgi:hypothetical protein
MRKEPDRRCQDCGRMVLPLYGPDPIGRAEDYWLHWQVWNPTGERSGWPMDWLCVGCFERRLGRRLRPSDFVSQLHCWDTPRLASRHFATREMRSNPDKFVARVLRALQYAAVGEHYARPAKPHKISPNYGKAVLMELAQQDRALQERLLRAWNAVKGTTATKGRRVGRRLSFRSDHIHQM